MNLLYNSVVVNEGLLFNGLTGKIPFSYKDSRLFMYI